MPDFAMDYGVLHEARKDLYDLADRIEPTLKHSLFADLGKGDYGDAEAVFGNDTVTSGFRTLYRLSQGPMNRAVSHLKQLGDLFGGVANTFFDVDADIAAGLGVMGSHMGLDEWRAKREAWDYRTEHANECVPDENGDIPAFCGATDPGPPPLEETIETQNGKVHTRLTLDDQYNVVKEESTVTQGDQSYSSVTVYSDGGRSYTTDTTYSDGSKTHAEVHLDEDGGGTMTVTDHEGKKTEYHRDGPGQEWQQVGGDSGSGSGSGSAPVPYTPLYGPMPLPPVSH